MAKDAPLTSLDKINVVNPPQENHGAVTAAAEAYAPRTVDTTTPKSTAAVSDSALQQVLNKALNDIFTGLKNGDSDISTILNQDAAALAKLLSPTSFQSPGGSNDGSTTSATPPSGDKPTTPPSGDQVTSTTPALPSDLKGNLPLVTVRGNSDIQKELGGLGKLSETNGAWTLDAQGKQINPLYLQGVDNLTIKNAVFAADGMAGEASVGGVRMDTSDNVTVENSLFNGTSFGVLATDGDSNVNVDNNKFVDMQGGQTYNDGVADHQYFSSAVQIVNSKPINAAEGNSNNSVSGNTVVNSPETLNIDGKSTTLYSWTNDNFNFGNDQFTYTKDGGPGLVVANNKIDGTGAGDLNANLQNSGSGMQFEFNTGVVPGDTPGNGKNANTTPVFVVENNDVSGQITQGITDTSANHGLFENNVVDLTKPSTIYQYNEANGSVTNLNDRAANASGENAALDSKLGKNVVLAPYTSWQAYGISNRSGDSTTNQFSGNEVITPNTIPVFSGAKTQYNPLAGQPEINTTGDKPAGVKIVTESQAMSA